MRNHKDYILRFTLCVILWVAFLLIFAFPRISAD